MIPALLVGSALALGAASSRLVSVSEPIPTEAGLEFVARATPTRFTALNPTDHAVLLVFRHELGGVHASVLLAPGDQLESRFPSGTFDGLWLEVVGLAPGGLARSGALALDAVTAEGIEALWVERSVDSPARLGAWLLDGIGRHPLRPEGDSALLPMNSSAHVPGAIPHKIKRKERAPKVERDPLPPL